MKILLFSTCLLLSIVTFVESREDSRTSSVFYGKVEKLDSSSGTLSIRGKSNSVTFDATNPILSGYQSFSEVKIGDLVGIQYIQKGIKIVRMGAVTKKPSISEDSKAEKKLKISPEKEKKLPPQHKNGLMKLQKRINGNRKGDGLSFEDADINRDGNLSPVELSIIIKDLTMERFKEWDRNGNGFIDKREFADIFKLEIANRGQ